LRVSGFQRGRRCEQKGANDKPPAKSPGDLRWNLSANKAELARHYVLVRLDLSRDANVEAIRQRYETKGTINGVPWYVILDESGKPLVTSNAKELEDTASTNVGFPSSKEGIDHFMKMLEQTARGLSDERLAESRRRLENKR
jgi:hypothetical protein